MARQSQDYSTRHAVSLTFTPDAKVSINCRTGVLHSSYFAKCLLAAMMWHGMESNREISSGTSKVRGTCCDQLLIASICLQLSKYAVRC